MKKSDMRELRKIVKAADSVIGKVYTLYVDSENNVVYENLKRLSDMDTPEKYRHLDIITAVLNPGLGKKVFPVRLQEQQQDLIALKGMEWTEPALFEAFRSLLLENYSHLNPYYAVAANITYDVPRKGEDNLSLEDGDAVYRAMVFAICPAGLERANLGLDNDSIYELPRRWTIQKPETGFLYPSFDSREENRNETVLFSKNPSAESLFSALFQIREEDYPISAEDQQAMYGGLMDDMNVGMEAAAEISKSIAEKAAEDEESDEVSRDMIRRAADQAGVDLEHFDEHYEKNIGSARLSAPAVIEKSVLFETGDFKLKVPTEKSDLIRSEKVDGVNYILVPIDGDVTVNGVSTVLRSPGDVQPVSSIDF